MTKKNTYEFIIHLGVGRGQQFDEIEAYTGAMAEAVMQSRYPGARIILKNVTHNTDDKVSY